MSSSSASRPPGQVAAGLPMRNGESVPLPLFLPVYHPVSSPVPIEQWAPLYGVRGCIVNAYLLYKQRELRQLFAEGLRLQDHIGFDGLIMTDSGAFQGFTGPLYLDNGKIVRFQQQIGADVISPLDLVTPPKDNHKQAAKKLEITQRRIAKALGLADEAILAGVQQGGRYMTLRRQSLEELMEMGVRYVALGSLVPFFNRKHNLGFVGRVIREAREVAGTEMPIHVYGAGDPVELPFLFALGANVFDSASYSHYANGGWYMTPYGALQDAAPLADCDWRCDCRVCVATGDVSAVWGDVTLLGSHNLSVILRTVELLGRVDSEELAAYLDEVVEIHGAWFPDSLLPGSWEELHA